MKQIALVHQKCYLNAVVDSNENVTEGTMAETDPMTINERRKYIHKIWGIDRKASKSEKPAFLDQAEQVTQMHRNSLIRILNDRLPISLSALVSYDNNVT